MLISWLSSGSLGNGNKLQNILKYLFFNFLPPLQWQYLTTCILWFHCFRDTVSFRNFCCCCCTKNLMTKMSFHKSKCEFWYTYRFTVCILEQCISIHYFRLTSHLLFNGAVFVPIITYYGGSTMFSRLCGTVYSVNNLEFRLWAPFNTGGEMQFDPMCYTLLHKVTKTYIFQKIICLLLHLYVKFWTNFAIHSYAFKCSSNRMKH